MLHQTLIAATAWAALVATAPASALTLAFSGSGVVNGPAPVPPAETVLLLAGALLSILVYRRAARTSRQEGTAGFAALLPTVAGAAASAEVKRWVCATSTVVVNRWPSRS